VYIGNAGKGAEPCLKVQQRVLKKFTITSADTETNLAGLERDGDRLQAG
jgi:hypothetical protein